MPPTVWTRESYLARMSDLLRRTNVEDAEELVRLLEVNLPAVIKLDRFDECRALVRQGNKIMAIKIYRELTGVGLKEAKDAVEAPDFAPPLAASPVSSTAHPARIEEVRAFIAAGHKIEAIKLYRELTGLGLRESKDAVEAMERGEA
jgi:ribosomal protein L7/L12